MKTISTLCIIAAALLAPLASGEYTNTSPATEALVSKAHKMDTQAMEQLGDIYAEGEGVDKDPGEAMNWYTFAAQNGNMSANKKLWKLEGHAARKVKLIEREFDDEATHDLLAYLYLTHQKANILKSEAVPEGIKTKPSSSPGYVMPPEYKPAIVKKYLRKGANPLAYIPIENINYPLGASGMKLNVFALVARHNDFKTLDLLISYGCTINNHGEHLIHRTFNEMSSGNAKEAARMLQYLQSRGAHFKAMTDWGATWIMECACADSHKGIEFLISQGVDPSACIENRYIIAGKFRAATIGDTALLMASRNKNVRSMDALIKGKANLNYIWKGKTVLDSALKDEGVVFPPAASYKKELARLLELSKNPKKTKKGIVTKLTHAKDFSVANLLKLAGAKTAAELSGIDSEPEAPTP